MGWEFPRSLENLKLIIVNSKISNNLLAKPVRVLVLHYHLILFSLTFLQIFDRFTSMYFLVWGQLNGSIF